MQLRIFILALGFALVVALPEGSAAPPDEAKKIKDCQVIDERGSYVLTDNLPGAGGLLAAGPAGVVAGDCLVMTTGGVTIDLGGFVIQGNGSAGSSGVKNTGGEAPQGNVVVRDGTITGFDQGITLNVNTARGNTVERVRALNNAVVGIRGGSNGRIVDNVARFNGNGLQFNCPSLISGNVVTDNGALPADDLVFIGGGGGEPATACRLTDNVISNGPSGFNNHVAGP